MGFRDPLDKKKHRLEIKKSTRKCTFCPMHGGENASKKPKSDKYKSARKGR